MIGDRVSVAPNVNSHKHLKVHLGAEPGGVAEEDPQ